MNAVSAIPTLDIDFIPTEDNMELASSPHMQQDDLDLDLDTAQELELAPEDSMVEDAFHDDQIEVVDHFDDDVMIDGDITTQHFPGAVSDLNKEAHQENETVLEDEDILYEDDEVLPDSGPVHHANDPGNIITEGIHMEELSAPTSGDPEVAEASEAHVGDDFAFAEQDSNDQSAFLSKSRGADIAEGSSNQLVEHEQQGATQLNHTFEASENMDGGAHADAQGENTEFGLEIEDVAINTNPKDETEALRDTQSREQDPVDYANTSAGEEAAVGQHTNSLETQDVALHTVKVIYQDNEICLFPPYDEEGAETFFLSDYGLAHETLDKLLGSCREVLADTIGDDDELVLDVAALGLHISEGSKYAAEITLSQILDVYLKLSNNDGIEQIEPLYCSLSSRVCLASQYAYLAAAAQEGKTITEIIAEHMDSPEFEALDEQPEREEPTELDTDHYGDTETSLPAPDQSRPEDAHHEEEAADAEADGALEGQKNHHLDITEEIDDLEAVDKGEQRGFTDKSPTNATDEVDPPAEPTHTLGQEDAGIEPSQTEYQEDSDEIVNDDLDENPQEQVPAAEQYVESVDANDETTSSGTVEAEANDNQEEQVEEIFEQGDDHLEQYVDGSDHPGHEFNEFHAQDEQNLQTFETIPESSALNEHEDDPLDPGPEIQEQPSISQLDFIEKVDETELQDLEDNEDLFDGVDASTDQTLENTQGDDEDDLDAFLPLATPAKTRSAKRKVEAADEDELDLLDDIETPDKKRRRPS